MSAWTTTYTPLSSATLYQARRTARADPRLSRGRLFTTEVNTQLAVSLPQPLQTQRYFTRATMPGHWLDAIAENQPSYRVREKSVALNFRDLPETIAVEFVCGVERQVQLGMRINAQYTNKLTRLISLVVTTARRDVVSLTDLPRDEWIREIVKARMKAGTPLGADQVRIISYSLARFLDQLAHAYHRGAWWELDVWNPLLDTRIPLREHEPQRNNLVYFSHLTTPWLRDGAKWWLSQQLEREIYTWSTVSSRRWNLLWFQRYIDIVGCVGPQLVEDPAQLGPWVQKFRTWLRRQVAGSGPQKGKPLGETQRRAAMTALEQLYRFMFEEGGGPGLDPDWGQLQPHHAVLFRFGDKPTGPKAPAPELVLSDAVLSRIAEGSELLARPRSEGGFSDEQLVRILGLLLRTGRRLNEIAMLDFDPLLPIPFPDPDGHVARLRYQQTKIITGDATILVDQEVVDLIRAHQAFAREFMARQGRPGVEPKYLFLARNQNRNGDRPYSDAMVRPRLQELSRRIDLRDEAGRPVTISKTHTFRHTKATSLLQAGVPLHVAMRYMGHKSPVMFMHYAQTLATTAEKEFLRYKKLTADGRESERDPQEMFEALALDKRTDRVLPHGYCMLPPRKTCDKGNACLSCNKFVTDESFEPVLIQQRNETEALVARRQQAHIDRFGEPMSDENVWLRGRHEETAALNSILLAIDRVRQHDGSFRPIRGAGAPQQRTGEEQ